MFSTVLSFNIYNNPVRYVGPDIALAFHIKELITFPRLGSS